MTVDVLIKELIATGTMNDDTMSDLQRMQADWQAGKLDPDDEVYLRALHARILSAPAPEPQPEPEQSEPQTLDGLTITEWRERALAAEAELANQRTGNAPEAAPDQPGD